VADAQLHGDNVLLATRCVELLAAATMTPVGPTDRRRRALLVATAGLATVHFVGCSSTSVANVAAPGCEDGGCTTTDAASDATDAAQDAPADAGHE
jgi:hypothetical protein